MRRIPVALFALCVAAAACSDLNTSPSHVVSIFVDTLPYPSIVQNDTLRDTLGKVVPMKASAFNLAGDSIPAAVQFSSLDANLLRVTLGTNFAIAGDSAPSSVRVVATAQSLQVTPFNVTIALRPDTVGPDSIPNATATGFTTSDTAQLIRGFCNGPQSGQLVALLRNKPTVGAVLLGVDNFIMQWAITNPDSIAGNGSLNDTTHFAYIVNAAFTPSIRDTTKNGGFSTRFLLFGSQSFKRFRVDTDTVAVTVQASTTYRGAPVPGNITVTLKFVNPSRC